MLFDHSSNERFPVKHLILAAVLCVAVAMPALAKDPDTILMPSQFIVALRNYLIQRPYQEVAPLVSAIEECTRVQVPDDSGVTRSRGECRVVTDDMSARAVAAQKITDAAVAAALAKQKVDMAAAAAKKAAD
jgi:hypothetical protein